MWRLVFVILFCASISLTAQISQLEKFTIEDGLSQGMIHDILQTQDGFLWVATKDGLNRYDGYDFKLFTHDPFNPYSISENSVHALFEDSRGWLWLGLQGKGINLYHAQTGKFYPLLTEKAKNWGIVQTFAEAPNGNMWIGGNNVLMRLDIPNHAFENETPSKSALESWLQSGEDLKQTELTHLLPPHPKENAILVKQLLYTEKEGLVIGTIMNHYLLNTVDLSLQPIVEQEEIDIDIEYGLMGAEQNGRLWFLSTTFFAYWQGGKLHTTNLQMEEGQANTHLFPIGNELYFFKKNIERYAIDQLVLENLKGGVFFEGNEFKGLAYSNPMMDASGLIWMGTNGYGLRKYNPQKEKSNYYLEGITGAIVREDEKGELWIRVKNNFFSFLHLDTQKEVFTDRQFLKGEKLNVWDFVVDAENQQWILGSSLDFGNLFMARKNADGTLEERHYLEVKNKENPSYIKLVQDHQGFIWILLPYNKVNRFDPKTGEFFQLDLSAASPIFQTELVLNLSLYENSQHHLWFCCKMGLIQCIPKGNDTYDWQFYQNNPKNPQSLGFNHVMCALDDPNEPEKYLWLGTRGGGLNRLDKTNGTFAHFTVQNGLPNNVVYGILADERGHLWMSTNQGLSDFDPVSQTFKNTINEGSLQSTEFNTNSYLKTSNKQLFFGGVSSSVLFHSDSLQFNSHVPKMVITSLKVNNEAVTFHASSNASQNEKSTPIVLTQPIEQTKVIELAHFQNLIALEYAALDFTDPTHNRYQYQLEGSDERWIDVGTNRFALYSNLPSGNYTFKVRGTNNDGVWSKEPATLGIIIHPPWWKTNSAYAAYLGAFLLLLLAAYRFQVNRVKLENQLLYEQKEAERLVELDKLKTNFFSNITHEFRTPLTLIIEPLRQVLPILKHPKALKTIQLAISNSQKLLQLVNQLLDMSKLEGEKMELDLRRGDIVKILQPIFQSFVLLAEKKGVALKWDCPETLPEFYFDKDKIEKITYNLLSNAVKFTQEGNIRVSIRKAPIETENQAWILEVSDSGIGIDSHQLPHIFDRFYQADASTTRQGEGTGIGLALTKELVEFMGGEIGVESERGVGTTFRVRLPILMEAEDVSKKWTPLPEKQNIRHAPSSVTSDLINGEEQELPIPSNEEKETPSNADQSIVLLIEDNAELRHFIRQFLQEHYQVIEASNGAEGIRKAQQIIPDLIVSDIMMPQKDGYEVCDALKNAPLTSHVPIILLTAKSAIDSKIKGLRTGADAYLTKPFHTEELLVRIEKLIALRKLLRTKYSELKTTQRKQKVELFSKIDNDFLRSLTLFVEERLADEQLTVTALASAFFMSRSQLLRKVKALTNQSPNEFVRNYRLDRAIELLRNKEGNVAEVASMVGFADEKYFSRRFKERFGVLPSKVG